MISLKPGECYSDSVIAQCPYGVLLVDSQLRVILASAGSLNLLPKASPQLGSDFAEVLRIAWPEPIATEALKQFRHTLATGQPYFAPRTTCAKADSCRTEGHDWSLARIELEDGSFGVAFYFTTVRKNPLVAAGNFRNMAEHAPGMIRVADPEGNCVFLNQAWYDYTGQPQLRDPGADWIQAIHPEDQAQVYREFRKAHEDKKPFRMDYRLKDKNGNYRWFFDAAFPHVNEDGTFLGYTGSLIDINERKEAEDALRNELQRVNLVSDLTEVGFWFCDLPLRELKCDTRVKDHFWLEPDAPVMIDTFYERLHPDDRKRTRLAIDSAIENGTRYDIEYRTIAPDGRKKWIRSIGRLFYDGSHNPIRFDGITMDVTARRLSDDASRHARDLLQLQVGSLERTLRERTKKLEETVGELEAFSYSISHDMRAPLRAMHGFSRVLLEDYSRDLKMEAIDYLRRIERGAKRLDLLIKDILAYSQVAKGQFPLTNVAMEPIVSDVISMFGPEDAEFEIQELPVVRAHEGLLLQVLSNLIRNAVKFRRREVKPRISIGSDQSGESFCIWIQDNGIGIDPAHFEQIFKIYGRVYSGKEFEGTGVGLAIVKKAIDRMGGKVGVISQPGAGSKFWFILRKGRAIHE